MMVGEFGVGRTNAMKPSGWLCARCNLELLYYNIGFDDGYQCPSCLQILERHELKEQAVEMLRPAGPGPDVEKTSSCRSAVPPSTNS